MTVPEDQQSDTYIDTKTKTKQKQSLHEGANGPRPNVPDQMRTVSNGFFGEPVGGGTVMYLTYTRFFSS